MKELMKKAHQMTREIKNEFPEVDYKFQLGLCISYLSKNEMKEDVEMVKLKGTEKQVKWAEDIRKEVVEKLQNVKNEYEKMILEAEEKGKRFPKRYTKNVTALEKLLNEVKENESAKAFIEEYRLSILELSDIWEVADFARNR